MSAPARLTLNGRQRLVVVACGFGLTYIPGLGLVAGFLIAGAVFPGIFRTAIGIVRFVARPVVYFIPIVNRRLNLSSFTNIPAEQLRAMKDEIVSGQRRLENISVFDPEADDLINAWEAKNVAKIEALLREGDARTRSAWDRATATINMVGDHIDKARGNLSRVVKQSERFLAPYNIDLASLRLDRSGILAIDVQSMVPEKRIGPGPANLRGLSHGVTQLTNQAMRGGVSWQGAAAGAAIAIVFATVLHHITISKTLRKLKDIEGELALQAEAASGDLAMFRTILATRMLPQFEALATLATTMEAFMAISGPNNATVPTAAAPPEIVLQLAMGLVEARHFLKMTAGD